MFDWQRYGVCVLEGPDGPHVLLRPHRFPSGSYEFLRWYHDGTVRNLDIARVHLDEPDRFRFESDDERTWTVRPLTVAFFEAELRRYVGGPAFESDEAVRAWTLEQHDAQSR